jgi:hypothetical protein
VPAVQVAATQPPQAPVAEAAPAPVATLPTDCAAAGDPLCAVPEDFVQRLCAGRPRQDIALALFAKTTPFTRMYLRGKFDELAFDEEVLVLRRNAPSGIVLNGGTFDVLRWDGSCSTGVDAAMLTRARPPHPGAARLGWGRMNEQLQIELIKGSPAVKGAHARQASECMGSTFGASAACVAADKALGAAIVDYVRRGGRLPAPQDIP